MDIISLGKASKALRKAKQLNDEVVAPLAETRFPTIDHRLDWLEGQQSKVKASNSLPLDLSQGTFVDTELVVGKIKLKKIGEVGSGYTSDVVPAMTSNTAPSPYIASASSEHSSYPAWKSFDDTSGTPFYTASGVVQAWIKFDFGSKKTIKKYTIYPNGSYTPKDWTFEGSNDDVNWTILDTQTSITGWTQDVIQEFTFSNSTSFQYYRLNITANNGGTSTSIQQLEMMESAIQNQYLTQGTWESPVIDISEGWSITNDIVPQITKATGEDVVLEIASSTDGVTFTTYAVFDALNIPQTRYVKFKATLSTTGTSATKTLDFNQADAENTFTLGDYTLADGTMRPKNNYSYKMEAVANKDAGTQLKKVIDKSAFTTIEKVEVK